MNGRGFGRRGLVSALFLLLLFPPVSPLHAEGSSQDILVQLENLEKQQALLDRRTKELRARKEELDRALGESLKQVTAVRKRSEKHEKTLAARLRAAYKLRAISRWEYLLSASDFTDFTLRRAYLGKLWRKDREILDRYGQNVRVALNERRRMERDRAEMDRLIEDLREQENRLAEQLRKKKVFLADIRKDERLRAKARAEMAEAKKKLDRRVAGLGPERPDTAGGSSRRGQPFSNENGRMACPVKGRVEVGYGTAVKGKARTFHGGLDLQAPAGAPVKAPADGEVVFAGHFRGFGNLVILRHGETHHSLYAHLQTIGQGVGKTIRAGEILGRVGDTGSLKGAYLYFEIREKGKTVNPRKWVDCR